jgi:predicted TIM-barrel fold metal-dependent hydrolase
MFDINTATGHWPFRNIPRQNITELYEYLSGLGIGGAAVANTHGLFYMNVQDANLELAAAIKPYEHFFIGVASINPVYAAAEPDLKFCVEKLGFRMLRLTPLYHNYQLEEASRVIRLAGELGIPVIVPNEIVNFRQKHWMEPPAPLGLNAVLDLCRAYPEVNFIFSEGTASADGEYPKNLYFELSRFRSSYGGILTELIKNVGAERVLFGTGSPFKSAEPSLLKLHHCDITDEERMMVAVGAARKLLRL